MQYVISIVVLAFLAVYGVFVQAPPEETLNAESLPPITQEQKTNLPTETKSVETKLEEPEKSAPPSQEPIELEKVAPQEIVIPRQEQVIQPKSVPNPIIPELVEGRPEEQVAEEPEKTKAPDPIPITLRSIVGLNCKLENESSIALSRGTGVIIKEGEYILTNRHVIDPEWTRWAYQDSSVDPSRVLQFCNVFTFNSDRTIAPSEKYPYDFYDLDELSGFGHDFKAELAWLPHEEGLSEEERAQLDFAILRITERNSTKHPYKDPELPAAEIWVPSPSEWLDVIKGSRLVVPGYAYQATGPGAFDKYRLLTKDAKATEIYAGDLGLEHVPYIIETDSPPDAYGGRSGSPIFYNGYVIGLFQNKIIPEPNSGIFRGFQTAITAIIENLNQKGLQTKDTFQNITILQ